MFQALHPMRVLWLLMIFTTTAFCQRGDIPTYKVVGPFFYGVFNHYDYSTPPSGTIPGDSTYLAHPDTCPVWYALVPTDRPPNEAGLILIDSGGLGSHSTNPLDPNGALQLLEKSAAAGLSRGYTLFTVTHGHRPPVTGYSSLIINGSVIVPSARPGWLTSEIVEQIHRAVRHMKSVIPTHPDLWHVDVEALGAVGGSSGGGLAMQLLVNGSSTSRHLGVSGGHSPLYTFDPMIDTLSSKVAAASVTSMAGDLLDYRGLADTAYPYKFPMFFVYPDLSSLGFSANFPAPPCPTAAQDLWTTTTSNWEPKFPFAPELNWYHDPTPEIAPVHFPEGRQRRYPWQQYTYPPITCIPLLNELSSLSLSRNVTSQTTPALLLHGSDDGNIDSYQSIAYHAAAVNAGAPVELHTYPGIRHYWRDIDNESGQAALNFFDSVILARQPDIDSDADGQSDAAESQLGNTPLDASDVFRIETVSWASASLTNTIPGAAKMEILFRTGTNIAGGSFRLEIATDLTPPSVEWSPTAHISTPSGVGQRLFVVSIALPISIIDAKPTFLRVTHVKQAGASIASTEPVGWMAHVVQRKEITGFFFTGNTTSSVFTNRIGAALQPADIYKSVAICNASTTERTFDFSGGSIGAPFVDATGSVLSLGPSTSGVPRYVAMIVTDRERSIPATPPEDRGSEGHWWPVTSNTATVVTVGRHEGLPGVPLNDGSCHAVAIRPTMSLEGILGPPTVANLTAGNGIRNGDIVHLLNRDGTTKASYSITVTPNSYFLTDTATSLPTPGTELRLLPDETFALDVARNATEPQTFLTTFGHVPMSDIIAYVDAPAVGGPGRRSNIRSWPHPHEAPLWSPFQSCNLLESGFFFDSNQPSISDRLIYASRIPAAIGWAGDSAGITLGGYHIDDDLFLNTMGEWCGEDPATASIICNETVKNWLMYPGHGYDVQLNATHHQSVPGFQPNISVCRVLAWRCRRPYPKP